MDKTLKAFEDLGMAVGSIRARIHECIKLLNAYRTLTDLADVEMAELEHERTVFQEKKTKIDELMQSTH